MDHNNNNQVESVANLATENGSDGVCFTSHDLLYVNTVSDSFFTQNDLLIDSGCTFHISPFKNAFSNLKPVENVFVSMANDKKCQILGIGTVCLNFENSYVLTLNNVRYVSDLSYNLLSCSCLESEGFEGKWGDKANSVHRLCGRKTFYFAGSNAIFKPGV